MWAEGPRLTFQSSSFHQLGLFRRESRYEMFRKRVIPGVLAEALIKWMAASRSTAKVCVIIRSSQSLLYLFITTTYSVSGGGGHTRSAPPLPPAPALQKT